MIQEENNEDLPATVQGDDDEVDTIPYAPGDSEDEQFNTAIVVLLHCGCLSLNPFIEFRIWNNSLSSDVLNIQASISISPKYESKSKTTSHCHLLLHDCTNVAV